jgi:hypothetical protein
VFPPQSSTFEFPVYSSLAEVLGALELVVWDKNKFTKKEYLGEVAIPVVEWFPGTALTFDDPGNAVRDVYLWQSGVLDLVYVARHTTIAIN